MAKRKRAQGNRARYLTRHTGKTQLRIRIRPSWQAGAATAKAFAHNLNGARHFGEQIREGWYPDRSWLPRSTWYSAWRAAEAVLRPTLRDGVLARSPGSLAPETERRFERFSRANAVFFTVHDVAGEDVRPHAVHMLFELFESRARDRLKYCPACCRWFVDETKNRTKRWCDTQCHRRGWNRAARRAAGHAQYTTKGAPR